MQRPSRKFQKPVLPKRIKLDKNGVKSTYDIGSQLLEPTSSGAGKHCPPPLPQSPPAPHEPQQQRSQPPMAQWLSPEGFNPLPDAEAMSDDAIEVDADTGGRPSSTSTQPTPAAYPLDSIRPEMLESHLIHRQQAHQHHAAMNALYTAVLQTQLQEVTCSMCCSTATYMGRRARCTVRVISPLGVNILEVPHMRCNSPACGIGFYPRPTQIGCLPGTANAWNLERVDDIPVLWFHYSVLEEMDQLVYKCKRVSTTGYVDALACRWPGGISDCGLSAYTLREQMTAAVMEYRYADTHVKTLVEALPGWPIGLLAGCLCCYQQANGAGQASRRLHTLHFDLCFKLALFQKRNLSLAYPAPPNRKLFTDNADVQTFLQQCDQQGNAAAEGRGATGDATERCSSFKADKVVAQAYGKHAISAVAMTVCRHGHVVNMMNCFGGERHAYAIMALALVLQAWIAIQHWWYDINCRWHTSFKKWLDRQTDAGLKERAAVLRYPIPPWHLYAHMESCRASHSHEFMQGAGTGTGEVAERANAALGPFGVLSKYMKPRNREAFLERVAFLYTRETNINLPRQLVGMMVRNADKLKSLETECDAAMQTLVDLLSDDSSSAEQIASRAKGLVNRAGQQVSGRSTGVTPLSWRGEYAQARLVDDFLSSDAATAPPVSLLLANGVVGASKLRKDAKGRAATTIRRIEQQYLAGRHVEMEDSTMQHGLDELLHSELSRLQQQLDSKSGQYHYASMLVGQLSQHKAAQRSAMNRRNATVSSILELVDKMMEWLQWVAEAEEAQPSGIVGGVRESTKELARQRANITLQNVISASVPWRRSIPGSSEGAATAAHKVWVKDQQLERCHEEAKLLQQEKQDLFATLDQQLHALSGMDEAIAQQSAEEPAAKREALSRALRYAYSQEQVRLQCVRDNATAWFQKLEGALGADVYAAAADTLAEGLEEDED